MEDYGDGSQLVPDEAGDPAICKPFRGFCLIRCSPELQVINNQIGFHPVAISMDYSGTFSSRTRRLKRAVRSLPNVWWRRRGIASDAGTIRRRRRANFAARPTPATRNAGVALPLPPHLSSFAPSSRNRPTLSLRYLNGSIHSLLITRVKKSKLEPNRIEINQLDSFIKCWCRKSQHVSVW